MSLPARAERSAVLLLAVALDMLFGEPPNRWHPVAWLGAAIDRLERPARLGPQGSLRNKGAVLAAGLVGSCLLAGAELERFVSGQPLWLRLALQASALKLSLSLRGLAQAGERVRLHLERGDLPKARSDLRALVSRPAEQLDDGQVASAAIESVAENLCDSVVAPLLFYVALGLPGAFGYRAANTLDAMIGYHGEYEDIGRAAARLDDLLNLLPARLSALFLVGAAWLGPGDWLAAWSAWSCMRRDHTKTESPNAGWPISAAAGALRVRLEKIGHYRVGQTFPAPGPRDIRRAVRLHYGAAALAVVAALAIGLICSPAKRGPRD